MELLRQMKNFTKSKKDKIQICKTYIRSVLEQSCVVWNYNISKKRELELERVQKVAVRLISDSDNLYQNVLKELNLETLKSRRNKLSEAFAEKCLKNDQNKVMFKRNKRPHKMVLRNVEKYKIKHARTARLQRSAIIKMTKHLNKKHDEKKTT